LAAVGASGALVLWYPADSGFTITTMKTTHYLSGGVFLGALLLIFADVAIAAYLLWHVYKSS
jgi:hypothetical protein